MFLNTQSETGFARVLGVDSIAVDKQAGVKVRPSLSADDVVPVSVVKDELDYLLEQDQTEHIILKYGGGDGSNGAWRNQFIWSQGRRRQPVLQLDPERLHYGDCHRRKKCIPLTRKYGRSHL